MKTSVLKMMVLIGLMVLVTAACAATEEAVPAVSTAVSVEESPAAVSSIVGGTLEPANYARLSFQVPGLVTEVLVKEGDEVNQGDVLAVIGDSSSTEAQVKQAKLALVQAENALNDLVDSAGLAYVDAWQRVVDAETALSDAQKRLDDVDMDAYDDDVDAAKETITDREQDLQDAQDDLENYLDLDEENATRKAREDDVEKAEDALRDAKTVLQDLENEYAQLQIDVSGAEELLTQAQSDLQDLKDGPAPDDLALAEANVAAAKAQLLAAETMLNQLILTAPFSGTIARVSIRENEFIGAGSPAIVLADFSVWVVKTDDLTEFDILSVTIGETVDLWLEAARANHFAGEVIAIELMSQMKSGDVTYTVTIQPETTDLSLYWGMNVNIGLDPD